MTQRTPLQNKSLHLSFRQFADDLNGAGYTLSKAIEMGKLSLDMPWTEDNIKEIFRAVMLHYLLGKEWIDPENPSTTELDTIELQKCWDVLNLAMGDRFGVTLPFPSIESQSNEALVNGK